jgi:hypothetical protein
MGSDGGRTESEDSDEDIFAVPATHQVPVQEGKKEPQCVVCHSREHMLYTCPVFTNATAEGQQAALQDMVKEQIGFVQSNHEFERSPPVLSMMQSLPPDVNLEILRVPEEEVDMQRLVEKRLEASVAYFQRQADAAQRQQQDEGQKQAGSVAKRTDQKLCSAAQPLPPPCSPPAHVAAQLPAVYDIDPVVLQQKQASSLDGRRIVMAGSRWPFPAMASTSPQAVASCARMRVVPIGQSASSEKPAKELGKGKQKAPDRMEGSAKKPKTSCDLSAAVI